MVILDVVILSYSKNEACYLKTKKCLDSLFSSENPKEISFNVILLESEPGINWIGYPVKVFMPPFPYGYHKYMNFGRKKADNPWVALCNNDLIFHRGWFSCILEGSNYSPNILSFSPIDPHTQPKYGFKINSGLYLGYEIRQQISGWCIVQKREIYDIIGDLDESFNHWFCDNDYACTLFKHKISHALVSNSIVEHHDQILGEVTKQTKNHQEIEELTMGSQGIFLEKWKHLFQP